MAPIEGTTREHRILTALDALLRLGHVEAARLIIAEVQGKRLEDPDVDPLQALDDVSFEALSERIRVEAFRRERLVNPHLGDRWCKLARRVVVGDVVCFKEGEDAPAPEPRENQADACERVGFGQLADGLRQRQEPTDAGKYTLEREVSGIRKDDGWLQFEFADGLIGCRLRPNHMMVVKKRPGE